MEKIVIKGMFRSGKRRWCVLLMCSALFSMTWGFIASAGLSYGIHWLRFCKRTKFPDIVITCSGEQKEEVYYYLKEMDGLEYACFGQIQREVLIDGQPGTALIYSRIEEYSKKMMEELQDKSGSSPCYYHLLGNESTVEIEIGSRKFFMEESPTSCIFMGMYQGEQILRWEKEYWEGLLCENDFRQNMSDSTKWKWYIAGAEDEIEYLCSKIKQLDKIQQQKYQDTQRWEHAVEITKMIKQITSFFFLLFMIAGILVLNVMMLTIAWKRIKTDQAYFQMGFREKDLEKWYYQFWIMALIPGMILGIGTGVYLGLKIAAEGLFRLGIHCEKRIVIQICLLVIFVCAGYIYMSCEISRRVLRTFYRNEQRDNKYGFLQKTSLWAVACSAIVLVITIQYGVARRLVKDELYGQRYNYRSQVVYSDYQKIEDIRKQLLELEISQYDFFCSIPAVFKKDGKEIEVRVMAIPEDTSSVSLRDKKGDFLSFENNKIIISQKTSKELNANPDDIIEWKIFYNGEEVKGSCQISGVSQQYSQFMEYISMEDVAAFFQTAGIVGGFFSKDNVTVEKINEILYFGSLEKQKQSMEESFSSVDKVSKVAMASAIGCGILMMETYCGVIFGIYRKSWKYLWMMGVSETGCMFFMIRQGLYRIPCVVFGGIVVGTCFGACFLKILSGRSMLYPIIYCGSAQIWTAVILLFSVLVIVTNDKNNIQKDIIN